MNKNIFLLFIFLLLFLVPVVLADEQEEDDSCGWFNIDSCLPDIIYKTILFISNAPIIPLLSWTQSLLTTEISPTPFYQLWKIITYILSFFYIFLFVYSGFIFLTSSSNPIRRSQSKEWLTNAVIMIVLINGSYYIYELILNLSSIISKSLLSIIDNTFFLFTIDNLSNIALQIVFSLLYVIVLLFTLLFLVIRFLVVYFGILFFPIALFCYFTPPLKGYGKFIIHILAIFIFITVIDLLIILGCSIIVKLPVFQNFKIMVMIACFLIIDYTLYWALNYAMHHTTQTNIKEDLLETGKYLAMAFGA